MESIYAGERFVVCVQKKNQLLPWRFLEDFKVAARITLGTPWPVGAVAACARVLSRKFGYRSEKSEKQTNKKKKSMSHHYSPIVL